MSQLIVLVGAGASYDCASNYQRRVIAFRPPLVKELFESRPDTFNAILHRYPLAEAAAAQIRPVLSRGAIVFEEYLRTRFQESDHPYTRRKLFSIPPYLQDLLFEVGQPGGYTAHPDNYDHLISIVTELDEVVFVTLNYDLLLDRRLSNLEPLDSLGSYVDPGRRWSLIKLHGSVNWGRRLWVPPEGEADGRYYAAAFDYAAIHLELEDGIELRPDHSIGAMRNGGAQRGNQVLAYYPALALPLGSEDELVCPPDHVEHLRRRLRADDGLRLLVVGYSGNDQEVRNLIRESGNKIRSLLVANGDRDRSMLTVEIFANELGFVPRNEMAFAGGFDDLLRDEDVLSRYVDAAKA
jgi:hypothetical protein